MRNLDIDFFVLENGLTALFINTGLLPTFTALLLVKAGSRYESKKENGIAHFFEHMAFKGSKKYPDSQILASTIEGIGGEFNAFTSVNHTGYWVKATTDHIEVVLDVLSDMIQQPLLKESEIEKERQVIIEEINMYEDLPQRKVMSEFIKLVFGDHPLGRPILGTKKNLLSFKREDFFSYLEKLYFPANTWLVLAGGGLDKDKIKPLIEEKFALWKKKKTKVEFKKFVKKDSSFKVKNLKRNVKQAHMVVGLKGVSMFDEERYALSIAENILGGGMASRLFLELREKRGWCYYVSTSSLSYEETGIFFSRAGIVASQDKIKDTFEIIKSEHEKIASGKFSQEELKRAKEYIKGNYLLSLEDSYNLASSIGGKFMFFGKIIRPEEVVEKIEKVDKHRVQKIMRKLLEEDDFKIAVISPFKDIKF